ncbi:Helicase associated domain protein [Lachnospiraceae bacterium JLR.KK008]
MNREGSAGKNRNRQQRRPFQEWLADAQIYRETYGDLLVPGEYVTPEGNRLGRWIERKRAQYNGVGSVNGQLYAGEIDALEAIGMVWKLEYRFPWEEWVRQAALYYHTYGNLEIPKGYVQGPYSLGNWLIEQKQRFAAGRLSERQVADLEQCGVCWELHTPREWEAWYTIARNYYEANGNLRVRANYVTEGGQRLGKWLCTQRECYHHRPGKRNLSDSEIRKLEAIGMIWSMERERYRRALSKQDKISVSQEAGISGCIRYDQKSTGTRIRGMRRLLRFSAGKVAKDLHMTKEDYMGYESGAGELSLETAVRLAAYYRVPLEYVLRGNWTVTGESGYARESVAILLLLRRSKTEKREKAIKILRACLTQ